MSSDIGLLHPLLMHIRRRNPPLDRRLQHKPLAANRSVSICGPKEFPCSDPLVLLMLKSNKYILLNEVNYFTARQTHVKINN